MGLSTGLADVDRTISFNIISIKNIYSCTYKHPADKKRKPKLSGQNKSNESATSPIAKTAGKHLRG